MIDALGRPLRLPPAGTTSPPEAGEFWTLPRDGQDHACVFIAQVGDRSVSAWPVTVTGGHASFPAFRQSPGELGPVDVWPQAQFSFDRARLGRRVSRTLDATTVDAIRRAIVECAAQLPVPAHPPISTEEQWDDLEAVCLSVWLGVLARATHR